MAENCTRGQLPAERKWKSTSLPTESGEYSLLHSKRLECPPKRMGRFQSSMLEITDAPHFGHLEISRIIALNREAVGVNGRMNEEGESTLLAGLDKALLLALVTPVAYLFAFQFDSGYLNYFGVPNTLVDVSLRDLLTAAVAIGSFGWTLYLIFDAVLISLPAHWSLRIRRRVIWLLWTTVAIVFIFRLFEAPKILWNIALALIAILLFFLVALPRIRRRDSQDSTNESPPSTDPFAGKGVIPELLRRGVPRHQVRVILGVLLALFCANSLGDAQARMQTSFLLHQAGNGDFCAVIRIRDSDLLCAGLDTDTHQLTGSYQFLKPETATLWLSETGRLKPPELKTKSPWVLMRDRSRSPQH